MSSGVGGVRLRGGVGCCSTEVEPCAGLEHEHLSWRAELPRLFVLERRKCSGTPGASRRGRRQILPICRLLCLGRAVRALAED